MKPHENARLVWILLIATTIWPRVAATQELSAAAKPRASDELLRSWQWVHELRQPKGIAAGFVDGLLPPAILDKARPDLADLRLRDAGDREVPFALRIRKPQIVQKSLPHTS